MTPDDLLAEVRKIQDSALETWRDLPPPHDSTAETTVLGAMLGVEWDGWRDVDPGLFWTHRNQTAASKIQAAHAADLDVCRELFIAAMQDEGYPAELSALFYSKLKGQPWAGLTAAAAWSRVVEMSKRRALCLALEKVQAALYTDLRGSEGALRFLRGLT